MIKKFQLSVIISLISLAGSKVCAAANHKPLTFVVPEKPWGPVVVSPSKAKVPEQESTILRSPTLQIFENQEPPEVKKPTRRAKKNDDSEPFSGEDSFVSIGAMAISGRVSKPSMPFTVERVKGKRTFSLPRLSPAEAIRASASQVK
jgi:hypothetical protein